jgi:hypothetical protein
MDIGFVGTLETLHPAPGGVLGVYDAGAEGGSAVAEESPAHQAGVAVAVAEAGRGAVDRHQPLAALDEPDLVREFVRQARRLTASLPTPVLGLGTSMPGSPDPCPWKKLRQAVLLEVGLVQAAG